MSRLPPGSRLGRFELSTVLGQGAMGVVYLANDPQIDRPVAIKTLRPEAIHGEGSREVEDRFQKEARLAGRLQHPNIVTIYDVGRDGGVYFIAMEYVDGKPLTRYLAAGDELPLSARIAIIRQTAEALAHAHERGVVHRDIKPGNILVARDGRVKVTDFGIGRFTGAATSELTRTGQMVGSPAYMSPEQVRGERLDGRSDLFSLGVVLYELLTAVRPFPGESITTLVYQILHTEPRDPLEVKANLPAATREVMARLLAKQPERRPEDARAFIRELARIERIQRESEITRRAAAAPPPPAPPVREVLRPAPPAPPPTPPTEIRPPPAPAHVPPAEDSGTTLVQQGVVQPGARRRPMPPVLLAALAAAALAVILLARRRPAESAAAAPAPRIAPTKSAAASDSGSTAPSTAEAAPRPAAENVEEVVVLPTPGPRAAVDARVGAPRTTGSEPSRPGAAPASAAARSAAASEAPEAAAVSSSRPPERVDATYATRHGVRFTSSPEQARLTIDGRSVGIADDWDNRGGGREFVFDSPGAHDVLMELPGYRPMRLRIEVSPDAEKDSVSIDEELDRRERVSYEKLPSVYDRTTGPVEFSVEPGDAMVMEGGKTLGPASAFGPSSPLSLRGPMVHDLLLAAPGHRQVRLRILVAANAGRDRAHVKERLKPN